ncbi:hypothetical protein GDO78_016623 [Eleutherodactylus coqui]|uniref:Uncharacterized protein n=1 Tax=Eleutherodactylus coqui TaxID=57060 RepID=A0A8J6BMK2_ELECQ|nr:hypothetical protein GDO78_016623 [Eleutherodactylus coqui]
MNMKLKSRSWNSHALVMGALSKQLEQTGMVKETLKSECIELTQKVKWLLEDKRASECKRNAVEMQLQELQVKVTEGGSADSAV